MASDLFLAFTLAPFQQWQNPKSHHGFIAKVRCDIHVPGKNAVLRESALADNDMKDDFTADNLSFTDIPVDSQLHVYQGSSGQWFIKKLVKAASPEDDSPAYMPSDARPIKKQLQIKLPEKPKAKISKVGQGRKLMQQVSSARGLLTSLEKELKEFLDD